ncbi:phage tail length tape measure family protein [Vibrio vulnificus]|nr:phage tail length tape measure family protein [Vibrio vulnificus]
MAKQKITDLIANLDAETAKFDQKVGASQKKLKDYGSQAKKTESDNKGLSSSFKETAGNASQLPGPLGAIGSQVDNMIGTVSSLGFAWSSVGGAVAVAIGAMTTGLPTLAETERRLLQQEQLIKATGYSSGYTAKQLDEMARAVAMSTLTSTQEAAKAIGVLLTFRSITNDQNNTFERTIYLAQDMASVMGGDITSAAKQLGKALEMPTEGVSALRESGISFTQSQRDLIKEMEQTGRIADAQRYILDELDRQIGGAAGAEAGGLIGTADTLGQTWEELLETMADKSGSMFVAKTTMQGLIDVASGLKNMIDPDPLVEFNDLLKKRLELSKQINEISDGGTDNLPSISPLGLLGPSKNELFNLTVEYERITARMMELQEQFKQKSIAQKEAQDKAAEAAAAREKQRQEEQRQREDAAAKQKSDRENKIAKDREKREQEAADKSRQREQEQSNAWLLELERRNLSEMEMINAKYMDDATRLAQHRQQGLITEEQFQQSLGEIQQYYAEQRLAAVQEQLKQQEKEQQGFWEKYYQSMQDSATNTDELWRQTFDNFTTGFGNAFASAIMGSESFGDALKNMAAGMAQSMLAALGKIMAQRMVMWAMEKTMLQGQVGSDVARVSSEANSASLIAGINAFKSTAAIPITGPAMAPAAMSAALAVTQPMAAAATAAASAGYAGMFDNGGYIPAGQWGVTGEYGPEITLGPTHVIGRKRTMDMLSDATRGRPSETVSSAPVELNFHISALDATGVEQILLNNRDTIYNAVMAAKNDRGESF